jgi:uncharacterized repeat protein (TIGR03843 family)
MVTVAELRAFLESHELVLVGQLMDSSNGAFVCQLGDIQVVYKPMSEESPLWDFPDETLSRREVAASEIDQVLGWNLIPPTVWFEGGEFGAGSIQVFIESAQVSDVVIAPIDEFPQGFLPVVRGEMGGAQVLVGHSADAELFKAAILDVLLNNADRKGGHILRDTAGKLWLIDHGVVLNAETKLRTVLWGWAGESIPEAIADQLKEVRELLPSVLSPDCFSEDERSAMVQRLNLLINDGMPYPSQEWPAIPWPVF